MWRVMEAHPYSLCLIDDTFFFDEFDFPSPYRFLTRKSRSATSLLLGSDLYDLSERVSALESTVHRLVNATTAAAAAAAGKYSWTAEFNDHGIERKYQWTARIKGANKKPVSNKKNYKWTSEIKGGGEHAPLRRYTLEVTNAASKPNPKTKRASRAVEIEEVNNPGALVIRQVFAKRAGALHNKGKKKELSPQDAAMKIQTSFRAYLIRRSQALRALRDLAVAKNKLKELRKLFNNFSYRRRITHDAEECQKFTEKVIVLLLTVDAIEGVDLMVRAAKRSMVDELEAMLDAVDPQPQPAGGRSLSIMRRTFDLPSNGIQKEIAAGVAQVVKMLNQEENGTEDSTFEACL